MASCVPSLAAAMKIAQPSLCANSMQHTVAQTERREAIFARELGPKEPCKSAKALYIFAQIKTIALRFLKREKMLSSFARM